MAAPHEPDAPLALRSLAWACAAFGGGVLLHIDRVPAWASLTCVVLILWRLAAVRRGLWLPGPIARSLLALGMAAVVLARSYSRYSGRTSLLRLTERPRAAASSPTRRSCTGFTKLKRKQTASDSAPTSATASSAFARAASSNGLTTPPAESIRSGTSKQRSRGISGSGRSGRRAYR